MLTLETVNRVYAANRGVVEQHRFGDEPRTPRVVEVSIKTVSTSEESYRNEEHQPRAG